jgi:hypothetical protein
LTHREREREREPGRERTENHLQLRGVQSVQQLGQGGALGGARHGGHGLRRRTGVPAQGVRVCRPADRLPRGRGTERGSEEGEA